MITPDKLTDEMVRALRCSICEQPAVCVGRYDLPDDAPAEPACDTCCGHGCEDGHCEHLFDEDGERNPAATAYAIDAINAARIEK